MEARSTNTMGRWVHFGGDLASGVDDGIGFIVRSASTGGTLIAEPLSDSDTAAFTVRAKGAATLTLGNSSNGIALTGTFGTFKGAYSTTFAYAVSSGVTAGLTFEIIVKSTTADVMPGDLFQVEMGESTATVAVLGIRSSTATSSRVTVTMTNYSSTTLTTQALTGRITWMDLT